MFPQQKMSLSGSAGLPASNNLYNNVSSLDAASLPPEEIIDEETETENPADKLIRQFGTNFTGLEDLFSSYPQGEKEAKEVRTALQNWLNTVVGQVNSPNV